MGTACPFLLYHKKTVSLDTKVKVFDSLVVSKMLYNVQEFMIKISLHGPQRSDIGVLLKGMLKPDIKFQHTTDETFAYAGLLPLQDRMHANRLRFLARLQRRCPPVTWKLLYAHQGQGSWTDLCSQSFAWFIKHYDRTISVTAQSPFSDWIQHIALDQRWPGRIRKAAKLALAFHRSRAEQAIWQRHVYTSLLAWRCPPRRQHQCPAISGSAICVARYLPPPEHWPCMPPENMNTASGFATMRLVTHAQSVANFSIHGSASPSTWRKTDVVQQCWPPMSPMPSAVVQMLDAEDQSRESELRKNGWWASKAFAPARQTLGAPLPPLHSPEARLM